MIERAFGLTTDLYELTMAAAYFDNGLHNTRAIFDLFIRRLPPERCYLLTAGLEQALDYLSSLSFSADQIDYLREHPSFKHVSREFFEYLRKFKFTGDVWAIPEGTAAFGMEPLLRVTAPIIDARTMQQLEDNLGAADWSLTPDQLRKLNEASATRLPYPYALLAGM